KTAGHYHPFVPGTDMSYTEVYQVLEGEALYLLQKMDSKTVLDVITIRAVAGDVVLIPPNYGHITINQSNVPLKMANWVCRNFSSIYDPIRELSGGAYYLLEDGFMKNPLYGDVPPIRELEPLDVPELGLVCGNDMYELVHDIEKLEFLKTPVDFTDIFSRILR
ncbi:MAG: glucose-6-phosphate isomerase, partial [Methanosarcinaceae archaeon]|nr:glucose-6-phosphate isomerase [Methanosarcinaceae archaeon]